MKALRLIVAAAVLAYAGWLAWPWLAPLLGSGVPEAPTAMRSVGEAGAPLFGLVPGWAILVAAILLYVVAALMLGSGNSRAAVAYFLGFIADAILRLAIDGRLPGAAAPAPEVSGAALRAAPTDLPVDPLWLALGALLLLGLLVVVAGRRIRRKRLPGQFAY